MLRFLKSLFGGNGPSGNSEAPTVAEDDLVSDAALSAKLKEILEREPGTQCEVLEGGCALRILKENGGVRVKRMENLRPGLKARSGRDREQYLSNILAPDPLKDFMGEDGRILPVLKPREFLEISRAQMRAALPDVPEDDLPELVWRQEAADLVSIFVHDTPTSMAPVQVRELSELGLTPDELSKIASRHLVEHINENELGIEFRGESLATITLDGNYEASTYFVPKFWKDLGERFGAAPVVAFVARDIVIAVPGNDDEMISVLAGMVGDGRGDVAYPISQNLYRFDPQDGWSLFQEYAPSNAA